MSDMKEFLKIGIKDFMDQEGCDAGAILISSLGFFFWNRGGKQYYLFDKKFYSEANNLEDIINKAKIWAFKSDYNERTRWAMDFLDCVACLSETKVKELISKLKEGQDK